VPSLLNQIYINFTIDKLTASNLHALVLMFDLHPAEILILKKLINVREVGENELITKTLKRVRFLPELFFKLMCFHL